MAVLGSGTGPPIWTARGNAAIVGAHAGVAQLVEQRNHNPWVRGSSPCAGTIFQKGLPVDQVDREFFIDLRPHPMHDLFRHLGDECN